MGFASGACSSLMILALGWCVAAAGAHPEFEARLAEINARLEASPNRAVLYVDRGSLYHSEGYWDLALADFERAATLDPEIEQVVLLRADTLIDAGLPAAGLAAAEGFLRRHPDDGSAHRLRAQALAALGREEEAASELASAIERLTSPPIDLHIELARILACMESGTDSGAGLDAALASLDTAMERVGPVVSLQLEAVRLAERAHRYDLALDRIDTVIAATPRPARYRYRRGVLLAQAGRTDEAIDTLKAVCEGIDAMPRRVRQRESFATLRAAAQTAAAQLIAGEPILAEPDTPEHHHTLHDHEQPNDHTHSDHRPHQQGTRP